MGFGSSFNAHTFAFDSQQQPPPIPTSSPPPLLLIGAESGGGDSMIGNGSYGTQPKGMNMDEMVVDSEGFTIPRPSTLKPHVDAKKRWSSCTSSSGLTA